MNSSGEISNIQHTLEKLTEVISLKPFSEYVPGHLKRIIEYQKSKLENAFQQDQSNCDHTHNSDKVLHSARVLVCGHRFSGRSSLIERFRTCQQDEYSRCKLPVCKFHGDVVDVQFSLTDEYDQVCCHKQKKKKRYNNSYNGPVMEMGHGGGAILVTFL